MNDHLSGDNANTSPSSQAVVDRIPERLNLSLQQALGCLDIKLEDELTRFRAKQADRTDEHQTMAASAATWEQQSGDDPDSEIVTGEIVRSAISNTNINDPQPALPQSGGFVIINGIYPPQDNLTAITHVATHSSAPTDISPAHENLDLNFTPRGEIAAYDREYSASSQELLRQIQSGYTTPADNFAPQPQPAPVSAKKRKLFTPVKIGSLAAVCALAGGAAYVYLNPAILAPLMATKPIVPVATSSSLGQSIQSPNLAATEFTDLNLSTIATVKMPPTAAANLSTTTTAIANPAPAGAPVAIPYNGMSTPPVAPATIVAQPRLADSLIRSLLPPNFHTAAKQTRYPAAQPGLRR
jgi:hypothetical protein